MARTPYAIVETDSIFAAMVGGVFRERPVLPWREAQHRGYPVIQHWLGGGLQAIETLLAEQQPDAE